MSEPSQLPDGTSVRVHADWLMAQVDEAVRTSFAQIRQSQKLRPAVRQHLGRELAGAIGKLESLRLWLSAGAPS